MFSSSWVQMSSDSLSNNQTLNWPDGVPDSLHAEDPQDIYWLAQCLYLTSQYHRASHALRSRKLDKVIAFERGRTMCFPSTSNNIIYSPGHPPIWKLFFFFVFFVCTDVRSLSVSCCQVPCKWPNSHINSYLGHISRLLFGGIGSNSVLMFCVQYAAKEFQQALDILDGEEPASKKLLDRGGKEDSGSSESAKDWDMSPASVSYWSLWRDKEHRWGEGRGMRKTCFMWHVKHCKGGFDLDSTHKCWMQCWCVLVCKTNIDPLLLLLHARGSDAAPVYVGCTSAYCVIHQDFPSTVFFLFFLPSFRLLYISDQQLHLPAAR